MGYDRLPDRLDDLPDDDDDLGDDDDCPAGSPTGFSWGAMTENLTIRLVNTQEGPGIAIELQSDKTVHMRIMRRDEADSVAACILDLLDRVKGVPDGPDDD